MDWEALRLSLQIGISSTLLSIVVGIPVAYFLATHKFKGYRLLNALVLTPMLLPPTVLGYYLLQFFGASGFAGKTLESLFNFSPVFHWTGATIAAFVVSAPFLIDQHRQDSSHWIYLFRTQQKLTELILYPFF